MKNNKTGLILLLFSLGISVGLSDTLLLSNGSTISGTLIQTNGEDLLLLTDYGTFNFGRANIKEIKAEKEAEDSNIQSTNRLPRFQKTVLSLSHQTWASNLTPIPATVIDKGAFRNVPYVSFRCNDDYEVNIYGDLNDPAAIEIGIYRKLLNEEEAKRSCLKFIAGLLGDPSDREVLQGLSLKQDLKQRNGLSFEITPPSAEDAYKGWWVSIFSEQRLNLSRASEKELRQITVPKADALSSGTQLEDASGWSADQMKLARPSSPETITFVSSSGEVVTNAEVVRVVDGAYLIWRSAATTGRIKLSDLSEELRVRFGYDSAKALAAYSVEERRAQAQVTDSPAEQVQRVQPASASPSSVSSSANTGRVFVHSYTRKDGTYVHAHTRSYPRR